jgi:hypothetical protein
MVVQQNPLRNTMDYCYKSLLLVMHTIIFFKHQYWFSIGLLFLSFCCEVEDAWSFMRRFLLRDGITISISRNLLLASHAGEPTTVSLERANFTKGLQKKRTTGTIHYEFVIYTWYSLYNVLFFSSITDSRLTEFLFFE